MSSKLKILPFDFLKVNGVPLEKRNDEKFDLPLNTCFLKSCKAAIHCIMQYEGIQRKDEIYISTTTDSSFVSSCVTSTLFNYGSVTRILSKNTKVIFVIHEFGFPNENIIDLASIAKERNILLIEDAAHSLNTRFKGSDLGSWGDYFISSLSKSIPIRNGGVLISRKGGNYFNQFMAFDTRNLFDQFKNQIIGNKEKRVNQYKTYQRAFSNYPEVFKFIEGVNPFAFGFVTDKYKEIYCELEEVQGVEMLRTYIKNRVVIPLNPYFNKADVFYIINIINNILDK